MYRKAEILYVSREFMTDYLDISRITATKYLDELTDIGLLQREKIGRSSYYINLSLLQLSINRA